MGVSVAVGIGVSVGGTGVDVGSKGVSVTVGKLIVVACFGAEHAVKTRKKDNRQKIDFLIILIILSPMT